MCTAQYVHEEMFYLLCWWVHLMAEHSMRLCGRGAAARGENLEPGCVVWGQEHWALGCLWLAVA